MKFVRIYIPVYKAMSQMRVQLTPASLLKNELEVQKGFKGRRKVCRRRTYKHKLEKKQIVVFSTLNSSNKH